jgi:hypothetical protein
VWKKRCASEVGTALRRGGGGESRGTADGRAAVRGERRETHRLTPLTHRRQEHCPRSVSLVFRSGRDGRVALFFIPTMRGDGRIARRVSRFVGWCAREAGVNAGESPVGAISQFSTADRANGVAARRGGEPLGPELVAEGQARSRTGRSQFR